MLLPLKPHCRSPQTSPINMNPHSTRFTPGTAATFRAWLFLLAGLAFSTLQAQDIEWISAYGGLRPDVWEDIVVDSDGNAYVTGKFAESITIEDTTFIGLGQSDVLTAKFDADGNLIWVRSEGGGSEDVGVEISIDAQRNVYVAGRFQDTAYFGGLQAISKGNVDIFIIKYDSVGNLIWVEAVGGTRDDRCRGLYTDSLGHCYIAGRFRNVALFDTFELIAVGKEDVFVSKLDLDGSVMWVETFGGPKLDFGEAITLDPDGNVFVTGSYFQGLVMPDTTYNARGDEETFLAKFDNDGNYLWSRSYGGKTRDYGEDLNCDEYGNVFMAGTFSDTARYGDEIVTGFGDLDHIVAKIDPDGNTIWTFVSGASGADVVWASAYDGRGNFIMSGWYRGNIVFGDTMAAGSATYNIYAGKLNAAGESTWFKKLGNTFSEDIGRGAACDPFGNPYLVGSYQGTAVYDGDSLTAVGASDLFMAKLNAGQDDCAFSHATYGAPTVCSPVDGTYGIEITLDHYFAPDSGSLSVNGQLFPIAGNRQTVFLDSLIPSGGIESLTAFFTTDTACRLDVTEAFVSPDPCDPCIIDSVLVDTVKECKFLTNRYNARIAVFYSFQPDSGYLVVNGDSLPIEGSPQFVDLGQLYADGEDVAMDIHFSAEPYCNFSDSALFTAPEGCNDCSIQGYLVDSVGACDPLTGNYSADLLFSLRAWPESGGIVVNGQVFPADSTIVSVHLSGLVADGNPVDLDVYMEGDTTCTFSDNNAFLAPTACDSCVVASATYIGVSDCDILSDLFDAELEIEYGNALPGDSLVVNGVAFAQTGSPQSVILSDLPTDGQDIDLEVYFQSDSACRLDLAALFTAPDTCTTCALTGVVLDSALMDCDPYTNTVSVAVTVSSLNPPASGDLIVNGQAFPVGASPQSVVLAGVLADLEPVDVTMSYSDDPGCALSVPGAFNAPAPCDTCGGPQNLVSTLDSLAPTSVFLEWDPVPYATAYQIRGRKSGTSGTGTVFAFTTFKVVNNLQAGQSYNWTVLSYCPFDTSEYVPEAMFTLYSPRLGSASGERLMVHPNPSNGVAWFNYAADAEGMLYWQLLDGLGRTVQQQQVAVYAGNNVQRLDLHALEDGLYFLHFQQGQHRAVQPLVLQKP